MADGVDDHDGGGRRSRLMLGVVGAVSLTAYAFGSALFSATGIALFLSLWLVPVALRPRLAADALRAWPLWLLPALAFGSALWSRDPIDTLKSAAELAAFTLAAITLARLLAPRQVVLSLVAALGLVAAASLVSGRGVVLAGGGGVVLSGVFASKNALSFFCGVLAITGAAGGLDRGMAAPGRLFCWAGALAGVAIGAASRSLGGEVATALGLAVVAGATLVAGWPVRLRRAAVAAALALAAAGAGAAALAVTDERWSDLLLLVGKSPDLTGRLYLWQRASEAVAERPWLGVGYQAYFRPQFVDAQGIYRYGRIASEEGFHFHNLCFEIATELGMVGVAAMVFTFVAVTGAALRRHDRRPDALAALMLGWIAFLLPRTLLEVDFLAPFSVGWLLIVLALVMARQTQAAAGRAPPVQPALRGEGYARAAA